MATHKVRVGTEYIFYANLLDYEHRHLNGRVLRVVNCHGCPPANTMGHAYVEYASDRYPSGVERALVSTNSLYTFADKQLVLDALKKDADRLGESQALVESGVAVL
jgi:hypothetical protein